jgi:hypothetical protein
MRVASDHSLGSGGWIHRLNTVNPVRVPVGAPSDDRKLSRSQLEDLGREFRLGMSTGRREQIARDLGVSVEALTLIGAGWDGEAATFPMRDGAGEIVGYRRRFPNARKLAVKGSREGLFIPISPPPAHVHAVEGPTSLAAMLTMGLWAIGRPSCTGGNPHLLAWMSRHREVKSITVWGDRDATHTRPDGLRFNPGRDGAMALAATLASAGHRARVYIPPKHKDARAWLLAGGTGHLIEHMIEMRARWAA